MEKYINKDNTKNDQSDIDLYLLMKFYNIIISFQKTAPWRV